MTLWTRCHLRTVGCLVISIFCLVLTTVQYLVQVFNIIRINLLSPVSLLIDWTFTCCAEIEVSTVFLHFNFFLFEVFLQPSKFL